jgi:hypothetical protein
VPTVPLERLEVETVRVVDEDDEDELTDTE